MVTRQHLNTTSISLSDTVTTAIKNDVLTIEAWEELAHCIPARYESLSVELLGEVIQLWINIRGHSFAKCWTDKFHKSTE